MVSGICNCEGDEDFASHFSSTVKVPPFILSFTFYALGMGLKLSHLFLLFFTLIKFMCISTACHVREKGLSSINSFHLALICVVEAVLFSK